LRPLAIGRRWPERAGHRPIRFVAGRRGSSLLLDQPLTKRAVVPPLPTRFPQPGTTESIGTAVLAERREPDRADLISIAIDRGGSAALA
jgi:hypothetical protein